jgi:hypothetical protein
MAYAPPFTPSVWLLEQQMAAAVAKCDASVEQARLREEARQDARALRFVVAQAKSISFARRWG